jgi:hypothetical protein
MCFYFNLFKKTFVTETRALKIQNCIKKNFKSFHRKEGLLPLLQKEQNCWVKKEKEIILLLLP